MQLLFVFDISASALKDQSTTHTSMIEMSCFSFLDGIIRCFDGPIAGAGSEASWSSILRDVLLSLNTDSHIHTFDYNSSPGSNLKLAKSEISNLNFQINNRGLGIRSQQGQDDRQALSLHK